MIFHRPEIQAESDFQVHSDEVWREASNKKAHTKWDVSKKPIEPRHRLLVLFRRRSERSNGSAQWKLEGEKQAHEPLEPLSLIRPHMATSVSLMGNPCSKNNHCRSARLAIRVGSNKSTLLKLALQHGYTIEWE
ncbi:hypothetical protein BDBG_07154 [Blastomyces gilchristii SLH14081]|uniref:Uncharacterized protein n=1 Tax=Blastomyces gilchristii (strain SLH14081) TaxID=559298 RepID=A0A179UUC0_BLAGS|nr:uncharacterized protein BDBG_07154 [Blastomyces gilchristii SLH14081]OAT11715.1 hypothetical protein BDBG_07154 [Blastomyces gilchristii SLH14081]